MAPIPFIVGAPRSGTTLLRFMLDAHPQLAIPPETGFFSFAEQFSDSTKKNLTEDFFQTVVNFPPDSPAWNDFKIPKEKFLTALLEITPFNLSEAYRTFYKLYAQRFSKTRWGDKTPLHCRYLKTIESILPEAHFIHIIRDGRDVALSARNLWFSAGKEMDAQAQNWITYVSAGRNQGMLCKNYMEVRYEDLIFSTKNTLITICDFIKLPYCDEMLNYYEGSATRLVEHKERYGKNNDLLVSREQRIKQQEKTMQPPDSSRIFNWKENMKSEERIQFEKVAGSLLKELGYDTLY